MNTKPILSVVVLSHLGFLAACSAVSTEPEGAQVPETVGKIAQAVSPCDLSAPFGAAVPAFGDYVVTDDDGPNAGDGNGPETYDGVAFTNNGNTAYLSGPHIPNSSYDIMRTDWSSGAWSAPTVIGGPASDGDYSLLSTSMKNDRAPFVTGDGLTMYLHKRTGSHDDIYVATRASTAVEFSAVTNLGSPVNTANHDQDPYFVSGMNTLFFASEGVPSANRDIYEFRNGTVTKTQNPPSGVPINTADEEWRPVVSQDGLVLYFASGRSGGIGGDAQDGDIYMASRTSTSEPFANVTNQMVLNSSGRDFPVALSADKCTLYFATNEFNGLSNTDLYQLYKATRPAEAPTGPVSLTLRLRGTGSVTGAGFNCSHTAQDAPWSGTGTCTVSAPAYTTATLNASGPSVWQSSCTANGSSPSRDGVVVWAQGASCDITFE